MVKGNHETDRGDAKRLFFYALKKDLPESYYVYFDN